MTKPDLRSVRLTWSGRALSFSGGPAGTPPVVVDGDRKEGPSPMDALLLALAGCMAMDVRYVLEKARVPLDALEVEAHGRHAPSTPRRFIAVELVYRASGPGPEHEPRLERAIELSKDKYCSVLHSLDPALEVAIRIERTR